VIGEREPRAVTFQIMGGWLLAQSDRQNHSPPRGASIRFFLWLSAEPPFLTPVNAENDGRLAGSPMQIVRILVRAAEASKHDPRLQGDRAAFHHRLRELAILAIAAMK